MYALRPRAPREESRRPRQRVQHRGDLPCLPEIGAMDEQIGFAQEDAEAGVRVGPAEDAAQMAGVAASQRHVGVMPAVGRQRHAAATRVGELRFDVIRHRDHVVAVGLLLRLPADEKTGHLAVAAAGGVGLHGPTRAIIQQNGDGRGSHSCSAHGITFVFRRRRGAWAIHRTRPKR